jgi:hypothetical protein
MFQKNGNACYQVGFPDDSFWLAVDDIDQSMYEPMTAVIE